MAKNEGEHANQNSPNDPRFGMVGRCHGVRDHKEGEEQNGAIGHQMHEMIDWPTEPQNRAHKFQAEVGEDKSEARIDAATLEQNQQRSRAHKIQSDETASPLAR